MKTKLMFCALLVFCMAMISCVDKKQKSLDELRKFENELEMYSGSYTDEQWNEASVRYDQLTTEIEKYKYSDEELREIGYLKGKCAGFFTRRAIKQVGEDISDAAKQIVGAVRGFFEAISEDLPDSIPTAVIDSIPAEVVDSTIVE